MKSMINKILAIIFSILIYSIAFAETKKIDNSDSLDFYIKNIKGRKIEIQDCHSSGTRFGFFYVNDTTYDYTPNITETLIKEQQYQFDSTNAIIKYYRDCLFHKKVIAPNISVIENVTKHNVKREYLTTIKTCYKIDPKKQGEYLYFYNKRLYDGNLGFWTDFGVNYFSPNAEKKDSLIFTCTDKRIYATKEILFIDCNNMTYPLFIADEVILNSFEKLRHFDFVSFELLDKNHLMVLTKPQTILIFNIETFKYLIIKNNDLLRSETSDSNIKEVALNNRKYKLDMEYAFQLID